MNGGLAEHCSSQVKVMNNVTPKHRIRYIRSRLSFIPSSALTIMVLYLKWFQSGRYGRASLCTTQDYLKSNFSEDEARSGKVKWQQGTSTWTLESLLCGLLYKLLIHSRRTPALPSGALETLAETQGKENISWQQSGCFYFQNTSQSAWCSNQLSVSSQV